MLLSQEDCGAILERLGYFNDMPSRLIPRPPDLIYVSSGQVGGPKGLLLDVPSDRSIHRDEFFEWLADLGIDPDALEEVRAEFGIP